MIPILYDKNEATFASNGLGKLSDAVESHVTEILNGEYELTLAYPATGIHAELLENDRIILAEPEDGMEPEPFRIYSVTKDMAGQITVNAEHISYWLNSIMVMPFTATDVTTAMAGFKTHAAETCPFNFYTDRGTQGTFKVTAPQSIRSSFAGQAGSLLDVYGHGEFWFNRFDVHFNLHRGQDRHVTIRYGKNLVDLNQEEKIEKVFTGIVPYWADAEGTTVVTLPEKVINTTAAASFSYSRTQAVDFSSDFEEQPTQAQLRAAAQAYLTRNGVGIPEVSITVDFVALWQTIEYEGIAPLERVRLGDTVKVYFEKLGIEATAQVVKVDYDVLKGRYSSIELGSVRQNFADTYVNQIQETTKQIQDTSVVADQKIASALETVTEETDQKIAAAVETVTDETDQKISSLSVDMDQAIADAQAQVQQDIDDAIAAAEQQIDQDIATATKNITGNNGGNILLNDSNGDGKPDELLIMNTASKSTATKLWRWNLGGLGYSSSGYNGTYGTAITMNGAINASYISTGTLNAANITVTNLSATSITSGTLKDSGNNFVLNMSTGELTAKKLSVTSTNFTLAQNGSATMTNADITGKITATSGKIGMFDLDSGNGLKYLGKIIDSGSTYTLIQLYRSRFRMWHNTTSTGAWQNGSKEVFGVQYDSAQFGNFREWVTGYGYYSTGDIVINPATDNGIFIGSARTTYRSLMDVNGLQLRNSSNKKVLGLSTSNGEIVQPYTGQYGTSGSARDTINRKVTIADGARVLIEYGTDQNNASYMPNGLPSLNIIAYSPYNGNVEYEANMNAYQLRIPSVSQTSDRRLKTDIKDIPEGVAKAFYMSLIPKSFKYKGGTRKDRFGLIAQDVIEAIEESGLPTDSEIVGTFEQNRETFYDLCYDMLHAFHIKMIQEQEKRIADLEAEIKELKGGA